LLFFWKKGKQIAIIISLNKTIFGILLLFFGLSLF